MLPLKDDNPTRSTPYVTYGLIALNCLVYLRQMTFSAAQVARFSYKFGYLPAELTHFTELTPHLAFPVLLTPFTSMFLHGGLMHLGGNMLYLWIFGNNIEDSLGHIKFLVFYLISGLAAVALFTLFEPNGQVPLIGASGAISGVLGAYIVLFPRARVLTLIWIIFFIRILWLPAMFILGYWIVIQLLMALSTIGGRGSGGVAWFAHIGGFAFGWLYFRSKRKQLQADRSDYYDRWHDFRR